MIVGVDTGRPSAEALLSAVEPRGMVHPPSGARDDGCEPVLRATVRTEAASTGLRAESSDPTSVVIDVLGTPAPKGSNRAILIGGKARNVPGGSNANRDRMKSWDGALREAALAAVGVRDAPPFVDQALEVTITFRLARPAGHWGTGKHAGTLKPSAPRYPRAPPDIDKLARCTLDALIGVVFDDDARIVDLMVRKEYALPGREGAWIGVTATSEDRG